MPPAHSLRNGDAESVLIGKTLASSLRAQSGSTLVLQAAGPHASTNALNVTVQGFLLTRHISESKRKATVTLPFAQDLLRMPGQITQYVVAVRELDRVDDVARLVQQALGDEYQVTTWHDIDPVMRDRVRAMSYVMLFVTLTLCFLVASGIVNTTRMSVHDRVREIGTMLAVGVRRRQITFLFLWEALFLGCVSAIVGSLLGRGFLSTVLRHGVSRRMPGGTSLAFTWTSVRDFL
ncbi:MAG: FtsX-like permease family protein [Polyangiaceae bacterium]